MNRDAKEIRRKNMQAIKSKDTKIELLLRCALWKKGYRYRKNYSKITGKPDIVFVKQKVAIFCDSEFWHGFEWDTRKADIKSNQNFWFKKIESNMKRDKYVNEVLQKQGWKVLRFWGRDIEKNTEKCLKIIEDEIIKADLPQ